MLAWPPVARIPMPPPPLVAPVPVVPLLAIPGPVVPVVGGLPVACPPAPGRRPMTRWRPWRAPSLARLCLCM